MFSLILATSLFSFTTDENTQRLTNETVLENETYLQRGTLSVEELAEKCFMIWISLIIQINFLNLKQKC